ncbi:hypothetical protein OUZ56_004608 [Daphnia magna]|uniref:Uncharacterized protein n=1 Tax=Daphnia magna TaxID=35525 RepID=A0ABQ9YQB2_9CRUS|nr:hypothetical protein OUZ56_004608 [Daphnia magna]
MSFTIDFCPKERCFLAAVRLCLKTMTAAATYPVGSVNPSRRGTTDWSIKLPVASGVPGKPVGAFPNCLNVDPPYLAEPNSAFSSSVLLSSFCVQLATEQRLTLVSNPNGAI